MNNNTPVNADHDPRNADWLRHTRPTIEELGERHHRKAADAREIRNHIRDSRKGASNALAEAEGCLSWKAVDALKDAVAALTIAEDEAQMSVDFHQKAFEQALKEMGR